MHQRVLLDCRLHYTSVKLFSCLVYVAASVAGIWKALDLRNPMYENSESLLQQQLHERAQQIDKILSCTLKAREKVVAWHAWEAFSLETVE